MWHSSQFMKLGDIYYKLHCFASIDHRALWQAFQHNLYNMLRYF